MKRNLTAGALLLVLLLPHHGAAATLSSQALPSGTWPDAADKPIHVVVLNPGGNHWFWQMVVDFMQAAADDLGIELEVVSSPFDHLLSIRQAKEVATRPIHPDYLITGNEKGNGGEIIRIADRAGIPVFLFSNGFIDEADLKLYGQPRQHFPLWIGQLIPDNYGAGYTMGTTLIASADSRNLRSRDNHINILAIGGTRMTHASEERLRGLRDAMAAASAPTRLLQVVHGNWDYEDGRQLGHGLLSRHQDVQVLWAANDSMALGAMDAAADLARIPGQDLLFAGCGWYGPALERILHGELTTSVGGHFMDGAWALVMLYDYHHGIDFISDPWQSTMFAIDRDTLASYHALFGNREWDMIDFTRYSKMKNPGLTSYDFSLDSITGQLIPQPGLQHDQQ